LIIYPSYYLHNEPAIGIRLARFLDSSIEEIDPNQLTVLNCWQKSDYEPELP